ERRPIGSVGTRYLRNAQALLENGLDRPNSDIVGRIAHNQLHFLAHDKHLLQRHQVLSRELLHNYWNGLYNAWIELLLRLCPCCCRRFEPLESMSMSPFAH